MLASTKAKSGGEDVEAAFLMLAAQLRYQIDKQVYPPVGKGGNSPGVLIAALGATLGQAVSPAIENDPAAQATLIRMLGEWSPKFPVGYDPGWEHRQPLSESARDEVVQKAREAMLTPLKEQAALLANEEYQQLLKEAGEAKADVRRHADAARASADSDEVRVEFEAKFHAAFARKKAAEVRMYEIEWELIPARRWHTVVNWKAEDFFNDPKVIALCHAIEQNDLAEMERLVEAGANVNAQGKDGMSLLLWALPDDKLERFEILLEAGADPNVLTQSDFGTNGKALEPLARAGIAVFGVRCQAGCSVTHFACSMANTSYLRAVLAHGGSAKLLAKHEHYSESPLGIVLDDTVPYRRERVEMLLAAGANPNFRGEYGRYPVEEAIQLRDYRLVLMLLEAGANSRLPKRRRAKLSYVPRVEHLLLDHEMYLPFRDAQQNSDYEAVVEWLEDHGANFAAARADLDREGKPWGKQLKPYLEQGMSPSTARKQASEDR